jgi:hypothetical protein
MKHTGNFPPRPTTREMKSLHNSIHHCRNRRAARTVVIACLFLLAISFTGCSFVGMGIGTALDNHAHASVEQGNLRDLDPGDEIVATGINGDSLEGRFFCVDSVTATANPSDSNRLESTVPPPIGSPAVLRMQCAGGDTAFRMDELSKVRHNKSQSASWKLGLAGLAVDAMVIIEIYIHAFSPHYGIHPAITRFISPRAQ